MGELSQGKISVFRGIVDILGSMLSLTVAELNLMLPVSFSLSAFSQVGVPCISKLFERISVSSSILLCKSFVDLSLSKI